MNVTLYFVGANREDALANFAFDSIESANSWAYDQDPDPWDEGGLHIYAAAATIDSDDLEIV